MPVPKRFVSQSTILSATNLNKAGFNNFQVHAQASPNMTVYIEDGVALIAGTIVKYAGGNSPTLTAPTGGNKRIDIITIDSAGTIAVTQGTQGASPSAPAYPTDKLVLAEIYLRTSATQIKDEDDSSQCYIYRDSRTYTIPPAAITAKFGGTGADGALSITSGTTTIDLGGAAVVIKNYTSISITSTGKLAFSNPHANGTIIILKSQSNVTITSSTNPAIDLQLMGGAAGAKDADGSDGNGHQYTRKGYAGTYDTYNYVPPRGGFGGHIMGLTPCKAILLACGAGGGGGESWVAGGSPAGGAGGRGGGALYIECGGALNITSTINASGQAGSNSSTAAGGGSRTIGGGGGGGGAKTDGENGTNIVNPGYDCGQGGGGGGGGSIVILYATLTANSGTYTVTGGAGGTVTGGNGGAGGDGYSLVAANTEFL